MLFSKCWHFMNLNKTPELRKKKKESLSNSHLCLVDSNQHTPHWLQLVYGKQSSELMRIPSSCSDSLSCTAAPRPNLEEIARWWLESPPKLNLGFKSRDMKPSRCRDQNEQQTNMHLKNNTQKRSSLFQSRPWIPKFFSLHKPFKLQSWPNRKFIASKVID